MIKLLIAGILLLLIIYVSHYYVSISSFQPNPDSIIKAKHLLNINPKISYTEFKKYIGNRSNVVLFTDARKGNL